MLDERDKLLEQLQEAQRRIEDLSQHLKEAERDKESLRRQFDLHTQHLPGVSYRFMIIETFFDGITICMILGRELFLVTGASFFAYTQIIFG